MYFYSFTTQSVLEEEKATSTVAAAGIHTQVADLTNKLRVNESMLDAQKAKEKQLEVCNLI